MRLFTMVPNSSIIEHTYRSFLDRDERSNPDGIITSE